MYISNWVKVQTFPAIGTPPPNKGEHAQTMGCNRAERALITREVFVAQVAGFVQNIDTVCLTWILPQMIARQQPGNSLQVRLYVPLSLYGTIGREDYCKALVDATTGVIDPCVGPIRGQYFIYNYASTHFPAFHLSLTCETVHNPARGNHQVFG